MSSSTKKDDGASDRGRSQKAAVLIIVNLIVIVLGITLIIDGLSP